MRTRIILKRCGAGLLTKLKSRNSSSLQRYAITRILSMTKSRAKEKDVRKNIAQRSETDADQGGNVEQGAKEMVVLRLVAMEVTKTLETHKILFMVIDCPHARPHVE